MLSAFIQSYPIKLIYDEVNTEIVQSQELIDQWDADYDEHVTEDEGWTYGVKIDDEPAYKGRKGKYSFWRPRASVDALEVDQEIAKLNQINNGFRTVHVPSDEAEEIEWDEAEEGTYLDADYEELSKMEIAYKGRGHE
jgi:hypothetical protein